MNDCMRRKSKKSSGSSGKIMNQIKKEIDAMHKATADFVHLCIDISKTHPKGIKRIKKTVDRIIGNMFRIDKMFYKTVK